MATETEKTSISFPADLAKQLRKLASHEHRSLSGVLQEAARYYLRIRRWEELQTHFSAAATAADIQTEDDVEDLIDTSHATR